MSVKAFISIASLFNDAYISFQARCDEADATNLRNFLVLVLSSINGGRPSLMENLTLHSIINARYLDTGVFSVPVPVHTTSQSRGIAFLQWPQAQDYLVRAYIKCVRSVFENRLKAPYKTRETK